MISTTGDLCDAALKYLTSIKVGNKNRKYIPTGTLQEGANLKSWEYALRVPAENGCADTTASVVIQTSQAISNDYLKEVRNSRIKSDWNNFRDKYIYTKLNKDDYISTSSMFYFIYLFRYFTDKHFKMFTDIYGKSFVWLYNTGMITYSPKDINIKETQTTVASIDKYVDALIDEIVSRDTIQTLQASTSFNSCSSSSSSSSCSSSSSSSSCSSSSSSSSSLFIAYFNLG